MAYGEGNSGMRFMVEGSGFRVCLLIGTEYISMFLTPIDHVVAPVIPFSSLAPPPPGRVWVCDFSWGWVMGPSHG